jgi:hypothetical protein
MSSSLPGHPAMLTLNARPNLSPQKTVIKLLMADARSLPLTAFDLICLNPDVWHCPRQKANQAAHRIGVRYEPGRRQSGTR